MVIDRISRLQEIKRDRGRRFPLIELKPSILDENLEELPDLFQTARSLGVDYISFGFLKGSHLQMNPAYVG